MKNTQIDNYGYITIDTPEKKAKYSPKLATDELLGERLTEGWTVTYFDDGKFRPYNIYRRKVDVEEGYRLLGLDEAIENGDQFQIDDGMWLGIITSGGTTVREFIGRGIPYYEKGVRRRISSSWIPITTLPKPEDYPVWVTDGKDVETSECPYELIVDRKGRPLTETEGYSFDDSITHWMRKPKEQKPQPPKVEKPAVEVAFEKANEACIKDHQEECAQKHHMVFDTEGSNRRARMMWDAAIAFQRSQGGVK